ncbi:MAG: methylenetetrahydrofolate--tRNA-(uracil(54)-C(5))-methyltransferase (FADH(2)-oxidizing) TrmFO [SAR324 cluster bacterium]|nr:methylenetetrahydrofolate--tRNA-(uracil(54)-C(5))-methyltransferase (FADH(2)-oxidizing) TrmFO [SAR324 cluster bacterium]
MSKVYKVAVIGAGLAGSEAAWQLTKRGIEVDLYEMRPDQTTGAHQTGSFAELVCSNSFKSLSHENAHGLLKAELELLDSLIMKSAREAQVPAGQALAVDRNIFSQKITETLESIPVLSVFRKEISDITEILENYDYVLVATGPLTSEKFSQSLQTYLGQKSLNFYDAIAPVVTADSIDMNVAFKASRYDKGDADYINCPMDATQYYAFIDAIQHAAKVPLHSFEETRPFEGCLPIEVMAERGRDTLRFGPMKPVGLISPHSSIKPYAVVQLRQENAAGSLFNMVGFQTKMTWTAQNEVLRLIPGLKEAEFVRMGSIHRNTFINSPLLLTSGLRLKSESRLFFAGQITGVEGYIESTSMGVLAALNMYAAMKSQTISAVPRTTMMGGLVKYITETHPERFQPMNSNLGLLNSLGDSVKRHERKSKMSQRALADMKAWAEQFE